MCPEWFDKPYKKVDPYSRGKWLACPGYTTEEARGAKFVIDHLGLSDNEASPNVFPGPPEVRLRQIEARQITDPSSGALVDPKLPFSPPTGHDLYTSSVQTPYTGFVYRYTLHRVPPAATSAVLDRLN